MRHLRKNMAGQIVDYTVGNNKGSMQLFEDSQQHTFLNVVVYYSAVRERGIRTGSNIILNSKQLLEKIVWKSDTISLVGYVCAKKATPVIRIQDTPEYRLAAFGV